MSSFSPEPYHRISHFVNLWALTRLTILCTGNSACDQFVFRNVLNILLTSRIYLTTELALWSEVNLAGSLVGVFFFHRKSECLFFLV